MFDHEARELYLYALNNPELYRRQYVPCVANQCRRIANGTYDRDKAVKLWCHLADSAAGIARPFRGRIRGEQIRRH